MKKRSSGCIGTILGLAIAIAIGLLSAPLLDRLFLPWAFAHTDRPALTGTWVGSLRTATGHPYGALLELWLPEPKGEEGLVRDWLNAPNGELEGTAKVCDEKGQLRSYTLEGEPKNRQATQLSLYASPSEDPAPEGLTFSWMNGTWDRANRLEFTVQFYWAKEGAAISGGGYPDTVTDSDLKLTRGGDAEFQAICTDLPHSK
jgi:hypothetical protein